MGSETEEGLQIQRMRIDAYCSSCNRLVPFEVWEEDPKRAFRLATTSGEHISAENVTPIEPILFCVNGTRHTFNRQSSKVQPL